MFYAVVFVFIVNNTEYVVMEPMKSLEVCRAIATAMNQIEDPRIGGAKCAGIIFDTKN